METAKGLKSEPKEFITFLSQTFQALKLKLVKGSRFEVYKERELRKMHKEETEVARVENEVQDDTSVLLLFYINKILHPIYLNVEVWIKIQLVYYSNRLYARISFFFNN